ncbi:M28 family metallopeptidase [Paenibacillus mendelii]|uniref:M28 family metallopeptidase n=1 Tax=Paenibacillus mendelii TaxID=206163 RepID=A0ABV6J2M8_9BACL|nr:M28 family metallopeptidase [Paenibacillus mendelii]MCQ6563306.1 M28 family metallopeptidase [Paenibacillus mendelii]
MLRKISFVCMLIVFAIGIWTGFQQMQPPSPPSESNVDYPAYQRMLANLKVMTVAPHPSGSKELDAVRTYLLAQIRDMGLEATVDREIYTAADIEAANRDQGVKRIEERNVQKKSSSVVSEGDIRTEVPHDENDGLDLSNIWVKLDAPDTDRGILMMAHYDSEDNAPGAADDMVSVSALIEALREQARNPDLKRDLYFLFTDGEEESALGAKAFVKSHPELQSKIDLVLNFDARGNRGGLLMFETSTPNLDLLRHYQSASSHPISFSFLTGLYRKMPNGTDLTTFLDAGYPGLNFAVAEGVEHYHQPTDSFENLNRGTAYNFLQTVLEMADYGAQVQFQDSPSNRNSVFFTFLPGRLVLMSDFMAYFLSALAVLASLCWLIVQIRLGKVHLRQIVIGTGWLMGTTGAASLLSWGIVSLLTQMMQLGKTTNNDPVFLWTALASGLGALAVLIFRMRKQSLAEALAGLLSLQLLLVIGTTIFFYEISYLFTLPALGMLIVAILDRYPIARMIASTVLGAGIWLLYVPVCWLIYVLLMIPAIPVVVAVSVIPVSVLAAFFASQYRLSAATPLALDNENQGIF